MVQNDSGKQKPIVDFLQFQDSPKASTKIGNDILNGKKLSMNNT